MNVPRETIFCVGRFKLFLRKMFATAPKLGKGPLRRSQKRLDRRLEEVAKAVGGAHCRLQEAIFY